MSDRYQSNTNTLNTPSTARPSTSTSPQGNLYLNDEDFLMPPGSVRARQSHSYRGRSSTRQMSVSTDARAGDEKTICAIYESGALSPTVGFTLVNLSTTEVVICQICDTESYSRIVNKLVVFKPSVILLASTATNPKSKLCSAVEMCALDITPIALGSSYWSESLGLEYIQRFAFRKDFEGLKTSIENNYYAACCFSAALQYVNLALNVTFPPHSLRIKFEPPEGSMMIDPVTIETLELVQNSSNLRSKECLFGLLNETETPMGMRVLKRSILQPLTDANTILARQDAVEELVVKRDMSSDIQQALKGFVDTDKVLAAIVVIPKTLTIVHIEQCINHVIMLKQYIESIGPIFTALSGATSQFLEDFRDLCDPIHTNGIKNKIASVINEDIKYESKPLGLRNQRTYAVKEHKNGFIDVARKAFEQANQDVQTLLRELRERYDLPFLNLAFDSARQFYFRISLVDLADKELPDVFTNIVYKNKKFIECQTLLLMQQNQKILNAHREVLQLSDIAVQALIASIQEDVSVLSRISEAIAMLDMLASFARLSTANTYVRPGLGSIIDLKSSRHPIFEKVHPDIKYIANDVHSTDETRFQIVTGCNMSGKSTYTRSIALNCLLAQIGCFVPATYASVPLFRQLFVRMSSDCNIEANVSTFAAEMREVAFILKHVNHQSIVVIDELGRGTSSRDGLAIAIAISEALIDSHARVWFATHFRELARVLRERSGVFNMHLTVDLQPEERKMTMLYRAEEGIVEETKYGIALAKAIAFPEDVIAKAEEVSDKLDELREKRRNNSSASVALKRKKLLLGLEEQLRQWQTTNGQVDEKEAKIYLKNLQKVFKERLAEIEEDVPGDEADARENAENFEAATTTVIDESSQFPSEPGPEPEHGPEPEPESESESEYESGFESGVESETENVEGSPSMFYDDYDDIEQSYDYNDYDDYEPF